MRRIKYFVKMNILDGVISSWGDKCKKLGEVKLFTYILSTINLSDMSWTNTKARRVAITSLYGLGDSTIQLYLRSLVRYELLEKTGKGEYRVNRQYVEFGSSKKK